MKRFISLMLAFMLLFSLAACSSDEIQPETTETEKEVETTLPLPVFDSYKESKEFKDENGRVVYTVAANIPRIIKNTDEAFAEYVNNYFLGIFNDACEFAEKNISNAAAFMDSNSSSSPWSKRIDFEVKFSDGSYVSFIINEYFSMLGEEVEPSVKSVTFDISNGEPLTLLDLAHEDYSIADVEKLVEEKFILPKIVFYFFNGSKPNEEQYQLVHDAFNAENFYLTDDGISFYISEYIINPQRSGTFICDFSWEDVEPFLKMS